MQNAKYALCNHHLLCDVHHPCVRLLAHPPHIPPVLANACCPTSYMCAARGHDCGVEDMARTSHHVTGRGWSCVRLGLYSPHVQTLDAWAECVWPLGRGFGSHIYPHLDLQYTFWITLLVSDMHTEQDTPMQTQRTSVQ